MTVEVDGRRFNFVRGSDLIRDGMFIELHDENGVALAEVFYSDLTGHMTFNAYAIDLPLRAVDHLTALAKTALPPSTSQPEG